jgi:hypothetical protein
MVIDSRKSELELTALQPWVVLADRLGVPRSLGQLYGLLFISDAPLSAQDCADQLHISRSSAGQGLKQLKELGAIRADFRLGDRAERFVIEPDLGIFVSRILEGRLLPAFTDFFKAFHKNEGFNLQISDARKDKLLRWEDKIGSAYSKIKEVL